MKKSISLILSLIFIIIFIFRVLGNTQNNPLFVMTEIQQTTELTMTPSLVSVETTEYLSEAFTIEMFNMLTKEELMNFPGIGEVIAQAILDYINTNGPFKSFDELMRVKGIGHKKLEKIMLNLP